ncbi:aminoglycoside phosphotransferase family protein [Mycobacterium sp. LTG2003]
MATVRSLVDEQFPAWRGLRIVPVAQTGTVNAIYRIGDGLAARFLLQRENTEAARELVRAEAQAAADLFGRTRFATPAPVAVGEPGHGYPMPWSVQTWVSGVDAMDRDPATSAGFAADLAEFVAGVRSIGTSGRRFSGHGRGGELKDHDAWMHTCLERSSGLFDVGVLRRLWEEMRELPRGPDADMMSHGDLIPGNLVVSVDHRLAGVLDVGGLAPADPALDLVSGWHLLEDGPRSIFRERLACDELVWQRGRAWAFQQAMGLAWYYATSHPPLSWVGRRTLRRITAARA